MIRLAEFCGQGPMNRTAGGHHLGPQAPMVGVPQIIDRTPQLPAPLPGLFGAEDQTPSPAQVAELEQALKASGKACELHSYQGAGHGFFAADRPSYRAEAAADGHARIPTWLGRYLASGFNAGL